MRKSFVTLSALALICMICTLTVPSVYGASPLPAETAATSSSDNNTTLDNSRPPLAPRGQAPTSTPTPAPATGPAAVSGLTTNSTTINTYDKFEVSFNIPTTTATNLQFPYDASAPAGIKSVQGISVDGLFSNDNWTSTITQPGFIYQDFNSTVVNSSEHLYPVGSEIWKIRFSPLKPASYHYKIRIVDASGTRFYPTTGDLTFTATAPAAGNHGFIQDSKTDSRYFQFSDGTPFIGIGTNTTYSAADTKVADLTSYISQMSQNGANFIRTWFSDLSLYGSSWSPWNSHHLGYNSGYIPANGMSYDDSYQNDQFSMKLDNSNPCLFQGWFDNVAVMPSKSYQLMVRAKISNVTGSGKYGFAVKTAPWLDKSCSNPDNGTYLLPRVTTSNGTWQEFKVNFTTTSNQYFLNNLYLALENATGGAVYIDEVSIKENLGNGNLGPEIVNKGKADQQFYYSDTAADRIDSIVAQAEQAKVYLKPVVLEKNDFTFGHINPDGTILKNSDPAGDNDNFYGQDNTEVRRLQQYYWRYLTARWGYSTAIQSWELLNEGDPWNTKLYDQTEAFATYMQANDPNRHMATTSFWHSLPITQFWSNTSYSAVSFADAHAYSGQTSWLTFNNNNVDPITGVNISNDSAVYSYAHSMSANTQFNNTQSKPLIMGEAGIVNNGVEMGNGDTDTKGVWLHQWLWGQVNPGASQYSLYWWNDSIIKYNLFPIFKAYSTFMQGSATDTINKRIPVNNGKYTDIALKVPSNIFGWGQKDTTNGGAYFWLYDKNYTFTNPNGGSNVSGLTVSFDGLPAKTYTVEWLDTWTGKVTTETRTHTGGTMTLKVPAGLAEKDVAVKIFPSTGY